jgi:hypothetical protein
MLAPRLPSLVIYRAMRSPKEKTIMLFLILSSCFLVS